MKKIFCLIPVSIGLIGCSKSDLSNSGRYPERETGTNSEITVNRPRLQLPTNKPITSDSPNGAIIASTIAQAAPVSNQQTTNAPDNRESNTAPSETESPDRQQGKQITPEPKTGDDANPDAQNPDSETP